MVQCVAAAARANRAVGNFAIALGSGYATFDGEGSPFSKVAGVGFGELPTVDEITEVERRITDAGGVVQFEIAHLARPELAECLTRRGYQLVSFENVLGRRLGVDDMPDLDRSPHITVERAERRRAEWMDVVLRGSLAPDTVGVAQHEAFPADELRRAEETGMRAGSRIYLAALDGTPAGGGGLRIVDGIAQLTGAATAPEYRRRGVQSALLNVRLGDAAREGCDLAVVTTQPGSVSHSNMQKFGFDLLYTRAILALRE